MINIIIINIYNSYWKIPLLKILISICLPFTLIKVSINKHLFPINTHKSKIFFFLFTQPAQDVPGTSSKGPLKVLMSGTYKRSSEDSQATNANIDYLMKKLHFTSKSPCITCLFLVLQGKEIF